MSDSNRGDVTPLGVVAIVSLVVGLGGFALQPKLASYDNGSPPDLTRCHYADAKQATDNAQSAYDKLAETTPKTLREYAKLKLQAAVEQKAKAESCEDTEHNSSDLAAQWASAKAAQNTVALANQLVWTALDWQGDRANDWSGTVLCSAC